MPFTKTRHLTREEKPQGTYFRVSNLMKTITVTSHNTRTNCSIKEFPKTALDFFH